MVVLKLLRIGCYASFGAAIVVLLVPAATAEEEPSDPEQRDCEVWLDFGVESISWLSIVASGRVARAWVSGGELQFIAYLPGTPDETPYVFGVVSCVRETVENYVRCLAASRDGAQVLACVEQ